MASFRELDLVNEYLNVGMEMMHGSEGVLGANTRLVSLDMGVGAKEIELIEHLQGDTAVLVGLVLRLGDESVILERGLNLVDPVEIALAVRSLVSEEVRIENGVLVRDGDVRKRIRALGVEMEEIVERRVELAVSRVRKSKRRTAILDDGSDLKTEWRYEMGDFAYGLFPDGTESISDDNPVVIMFPGLSDSEVKLWYNFGFAPENMVMIEKEKEIANILNRRYGANGATVLEGKFGSKFGNGNGMEWDVKICNIFEGNFGWKEALCDIAGYVKCFDSCNF